MTRPARPTVSVVVPFKGDEAAARRLLDALDDVAIREEDEVLVVDNTRAGVLTRVAAGRRVRALHAAAESSSYYARNVGAEVANGEWVLFTDADCRPRASILDDYFIRVVEPQCGARAGEVIGVAGQTALVARYAVARRYLNQWGHLASSVRPFAGTANLLVRREAWLDVGGFCEGIRTGGDQDFTWRLQDRGWTIEYAREAIVEHVHRERVGDLAEQAFRYGVAVAWLGRRHPNTYKHASTTRALAGAVRILIHAAARAARGGREEAVFVALDAVTAAASALGPLADNRARRNAAARAPRLVRLLGEFPADAAGALSATEVEALRRHTLPRPWDVRDVVAHYAEDDGALRHTLDLAWVVAHYPRRFASAVYARRSVEVVRSLAPTARRVRAAIRAGAESTHDDVRGRDAAVLEELLGVRFEPERALSAKSA